MAYLGDGEFNIWKLFCCSKWDTKRKMGNKIYGHNLIRLHHADTDSFLSSGISFEGGNPEVLMRKYFGETKEEIRPVG